MPAVNPAPERRAERRRRIKLFWLWASDRVPDSNVEADRNEKALRIGGLSPDLPTSETEWDLYEARSRVVDHDREPEVNGETAHRVAVILGRVGQAIGVASIRRQSQRRGEAPGTSATGRTTIEGNKAPTKSRRSSKVA